MAVPKKKIVTGDEARDKIVKGAMFVADAVKSTLGPYGENALLEKKNRVTNDGVTIAREMIPLPDEIENRGAVKIVEVGTKVNDEVGDGTTTSITLAGAILKETSNLLSRKGAVIARKRPIEVINQIEQERKEITEKLDAMATKIETEEQLIAVAKVSVEDENLGEIIGKAQWEIGPDGVLIAEETNDTFCSSERITGIAVDNGFGTSAVINKPDREALEVENVSVIYTNYTIQKIETLAPILDSLLKSGKKNVVIVARAFTEGAIKECMANIERGFNIYPLNAPYTNQAEAMKDMEAVLGGHFISTENGELESIQLSDIGFATKILARRSSTIFTGADNEATKTAVSARIKVLEDARSGSGSDFEKRELSKRLAQLNNGFSLIKIGAKSETERGYLKDKADDAVNAVRAALQEGVVPGAGIALKQIADTMPDSAILKRAIQSPYQQIQSTLPEGETIPDSIKDPVKVIRVALEKACSVASTLATSSIVIATANEKPRYVQESDQEGE